MVVFIVTCHFVRWDGMVTFLDKGQLLMLYLFFDTLCIGQHERSVRLGVMILWEYSRVFLSLLDV